MRVNSRWMKMMVAVATVALIAVGCGDDDESGNNANNSNNVNNTNNATNNTNNETNNGTNNTNNETNNGTNNTNNATNNQTGLPEGFFIDGLGADVTSRRADDGIEHIYCEENLDCVMAQGYIHARDRFVQMDIRRRVARGRISTLAGQLGLSTDIAYRTRLINRDGEFVEESWYNSASQESKDIIDAYTRGVNAWLRDYRNGRNDSEVSREYTNVGFLSTDEIPDWEVYDTTACGLLLVDDLSNSSGRDLNQAGYIDAGVPAESVFDILGQISGSGTNTIESAGGAYPPQFNVFPFVDREAWKNAVNRVRGNGSIVRQALANISDAEKWRAPEGFGSNNWVIGPDFREGTTTALLANDPHLGLSNPMLWYPIHMDSVNEGNGDLHVTGVSFAGIPGILLGRNDNIAWGATVVNYDLADVYVERLNSNADAVFFNESEVPITEIEHTFEVANGDDVTRTLRVVPHHGPVIAWNPDDNEALSLRWTGHDVDTDFEAFFGLATATNMAEAKTALENATSTNQNFVVIDRQSNIGWFPYSRVPIRSWASLENPPWLPLSGEGAYEWEGFMDYEDLPQLENPPNGFIATANQDMSGALNDGDPANDEYSYLQAYPAPGYRHLGVLDGLGRLEGTPTLQDMVDLQGDATITLAEQILPSLFNYTAETNLSADAQTFVEKLVNWDYTCPTGLETREIDSAAVSDQDELAAAVGCTAFHVLLHQLAVSIFADEIAPVGVNSRVYRSVGVIFSNPQLFMDGVNYFDDKTTMQEEFDFDIVLDAVDLAAATFASLGSSDSDWAWGRFHAVAFRADLLSDAGLTAFDEGPYAAPGGLWAVNVANPRNLGELADGGGYFFAGASMRFVAEATPDGLTSKITLPGGVRHFPDSPYYDNFVDGWIENEPIDMPFTPEEVNAVTIESTTFEATPEN